MFLKKGNLKLNFSFFKMIGNIGQEKLLEDLDLEYRSLIWENS